MHILIVDDHPLFREGLKTLLTALEPGVRISDAGSVAEAVAVPPEDSPELILLDMNLPGTSRLEALRQVKAAHEGASVVVVSGDEDPLLIRSAVDAGAAGYIPKTTDASLTIQALRLVLANGIYLPRAALTAAGPAAAPAQPSKTGGAPEFSGRQLAVLKCLLQGKANKVIARELSIAEGTVKAHLWSIYQALGVNSRAQAMYRVHELHIFDGVPA
ncbi:response regulator transcription factor [Ramlibacter henchirensis]|uniref:Response regulator transcription factor n=1 Tax=Ramlibacter henchirensis TaxID=204072 RepID=A0A4Z0C634_9BURK|nr:response regulator transcription factor [Ramlibacter henchirensis]TFZ05515.1 response regulator transcription factor [Ramlibacter henchirensis]